MRVKTGSGWVDMGPGAAVRGSAYGNTETITGLTVGHMVPAKTTGPILEAKSDGTNKLGIAKRWNGARR